MSQPKAYSSHQERLMMEALDIIGGARREAYGPPERNFDRIALLWSAYLAASEYKRPLGCEGVNAVDVCHMLDLVKLARLIESPDHEDSMRDRFGYQGCYVDLVMGEQPLTIDATAAEEHDLYETNDPDRPDVICDRNGEVVLGLCKKCGRAEIELAEPCTSRDLWQDRPPADDEQIPDEEKLRAAFTSMPRA